MSLFLVSGIIVLLLVIVALSAIRVHQNMRSLFNKRQRTNTNPRVGKGT